MGNVRISSTHSATGEHTARGSGIFDADRLDLGTLLNTVDELGPSGGSIELENYDDDDEISLVPDAMSSGSDSDLDAALQPLVNEAADSNSPRAETYQVPIP